MTNVTIVDGLDEYLRKRVPACDRANARGCVRRRAGVSLAAAARLAAVTEGAIARYEAGGPVKGRIAEVYQWLGDCPGHDAWIGRERP